MTSDRWSRVVSLYEAAIDRPDDEREAFLADCCPDDVELRREVSSLLAVDGAVSPLDKPVWVADNLFVRSASLAVGTAIGPYRIEGTLGAGGMGEVYRARDTKLGRSVALKVLPDVYAHDRERRARFQREAQILAALNHPHIAAIHGFEDSGEVHALVLELVEGRTLAERIADGPLPLEETMTIATQVVDAIEAAHDQGIVHRDLKPANIKIRPDGTVKVLDFGLARLIQPDGPSAGEPTVSPTITSPAMMTAAGMILGTAAYMSPEQAKGRAADARSDVWAFGCVLFEMITGSRPFAGEDVADTLAAVLRAEPDWSALPRATPLALRRLLERCLQKDRKRRLAAIADVRWYFEDASAAEASTLEVVAPRFTNRTQWMLTAAGIAAVAATLVFAVRRAPEAARPSAPVQFTVAPPANTSFGGPLNGGTGNSQQLAMSPDGRTVAFLAGAEGRYRIWLRPTGSLTATPMAGTEDASFPFWSPDSQSLGFFADRKLKAVRTSGGPPVILCEVEGRGGSWSRDGVILLAVMPSGALQRVSSEGGTPVDVIAPEPSSLENYRWPHFLPDGQHFFFTAITGSCCPPPKPAVIRLGSLDRTETPTTLVQAESSAFYSAGHLMFARGQTLMAQPFDAARGRLGGEPFPVAERVSWQGDRYVSASASDQGTLAYGQGALPTIQQMTWFNGDGTISGLLGDPTSYVALSLSPDEKHVVVARGTGSASIDLWLFDVASGNATRLTSDPGLEASPVWSPEGDRIAYQSEQGGKSSLRVIQIDGTNDHSELESGANDIPTSWSRDSKHIVFSRRGPNGRSDVWALPMFGDRKPFPVVQTGFDETSGVLSPDGRWIAFTSDESGQPGVFVQPFPGPGIRHPISQGEGHHPIWRADGRELFYLSDSGNPGANLMAVPVKLTGGVDPGKPRPLFRAGAPRFFDGQIYAVTKNGQRFLVNARPDRPVTEPLTIVINWMAALKK